MNARIKLSLFLSFLLVNLLLINTTYYATTQPTAVDYYLNSDGSVMVELMFSDVSQQTIEVELEQGFNASTLYAVDSDGAPLPVDLVEGKALIYVMSSVEWVKLTYVINNSEIIDDVVFKFRLNPRGDCTVHVPKEFLLLTFSGNPAIDLTNDETLLLEYKGVDVVEITLVLLQPTTQTTTSPPSQPGAKTNLTTMVVLAVVIILILALVFLYLRSRKR